MSSNDAPTLAEDLAELMNAWSRIEEAAKAEFPNATPEEIYQLTKDAMDTTLGINQGGSANV